MSRYEKLCTILSGVALIISLASPFVTYSWLDPTLKTFSLRGRLQVSSPRDQSGYYHLLRAELIINNGELRARPFDVNIVNIGQLPASNIQMVAQYLDEAREGEFKLEPPVQYEIVIKEQQKFIVVKRPLAPKDTLKAVFTDNPSKIVISNEYGESSIIDTGLAGGPVKPSEKGKP